MENYGCKACSASDCNYIELYIKPYQTGEKKVIDYTEFTLKQTRRLLIAAKNNAKK